MKKVLPRVLLVLAAALVALGFWLYQPDLSQSYLEDKYASKDSRFVQVAGMRVHYRDQGQGPVLVLLHGTASSLHTWDGWTKELVRDFRVVRMDLPGFGLTGPSPRRDYSIKAYGAFVAAFLDKLSIKACHLAGNSLGGEIAWNFARQHPGRVHKLILIDPAGLPRKGPMPMVFRLARMPGLRGLLKHVGVRALVARSVRQVYGDEAKITPALVERYYELTLRPGNRQAFGDRAALDFVDNSDKLVLIKAPTLIMWGQDDIWIPAANAMVFAQRIPDDRVITYPGVGHVPMEEIPERTAEDARRFLLD